MVEKVRPPVPVFNRVLVVARLLVSEDARAIVRRHLKVRILRSGRQRSSEDR